MISPPFSSVIPTFLICHPDRSEMIRNADRFAEWRDLLFPSLWWKSNVGVEKVTVICRPRWSRSMLQGRNRVHALLDFRSRRLAHHDGATHPFRSLVLLLPAGRSGS